MKQDDGYRCAMVLFLTHLQTMRHPWGSAEEPLSCVSLSLSFVWMIASLVRLVHILWGHAIRTRTSIGQSGPRLGPAAVFKCVTGYVRGSLPCRYLNVAQTTCGCAKRGARRAPCGKAQQTGQLSGKEHPSCYRPCPHHQSAG